MQTVAAISWGDYLSAKSPKSRQQQALAYLGLVKSVVRKFGGSIERQSTVLDEQDLLQFGLIGLLDAIDRFDPNRGVKFETYAVKRIHGTIQDEMRNLDWIPRSVRKKHRTADRIARLKDQETGNGLTEEDIAKRFALSLDEYQELLNEVRFHPVEPTDFQNEDSDRITSILEDRSNDPFTLVSKEEAKTIMINFIERLPQKERLVISLYYYESVTFKEIGKILRLSESRVFQIQAEIIRQLRKQLDVAL